MFVRNTEATERKDFTQHDPISPKAEIQQGESVLQNPILRPPYRRYSSVVVGGIPVN